MAVIPIQKPHRSEQSVATPPGLIQAACRYIGIKEFSIDLAANGSNTKAPVYIDEKRDSLTVDWAKEIGIVGGWAWLNPPYADIGRWAEKASTTRKYLPNYTGIAVLLPASVGANWWKQHVDGKAQILLMNGRVTFLGHDKPYPKDTALLLYSLGYEPGYRVWSWKNDVHPTTHALEMPKMQAVVTSSYQQSMPWVPCLWVPGL